MSRAPEIKKLVPLRLRGVRDYDIPPAIRCAPYIVFGDLTRVLGALTVLGVVPPASTFPPVVNFAAEEAATYINRGNAHYNNRDYDFAIADDSKASQLDPKSAIAYYNCGLAYNAKRHRARAIADYSKAIKFDPKKAIAYIRRTLMAKRIGLS